MICSKGTPTLIAEQILEEIRNGKLVAGAPLNQGQLAERFGVSRIPVREALRQLEAEGAVLYVPNRGAVVVSFSLADVEERFELRKVLEPMALRLAFKHLSGADLRKADHEYHAMREIKDARFWGKHHAGFHRALYEPAGRPRLCAIIDLLYVDFIATLPDHASFLSFSSAQDRDHARILRACKNGDPRTASKVLLDHLSANCAIVLATYKKRTSISS